MRKGVQFQTDLLKQDASLMKSKGTILSVWQNSKRLTTQPD